MSLQAQYLLLCQAYHGNLLDRLLAPSVLLVPLLHPLIPIPGRVPSQHQARLDMLRRKSCKIRRSLGSIQRMMKKIMRMCLGNRMQLVSWLVCFGGHVELIQLCCSHRASYADSATKHTVVEQVMGKYSWLFIIYRSFIKYSVCLLAWWRWRRGSICGGTHSFEQIVVSLLIFFFLTSLDRWRIFWRWSRGKSPAWQIR